MLLLILFIPVIIGTYYYARSLQLSGWIGCSISITLGVYFQSSTDWQALTITLCSALLSMLFIRIYKSLIYSALYQG